MAPGIGDAGDIAEGTRHRTAGYISRVVIALGEHAELETQAILSERRKFIRKTDMAAFEKRSESVGKLTHGLLRSLELRLNQSPE